MGDDSRFLTWLTYRNQLSVSETSYAGFHCLAAIQPRSDPGMRSLYVV